MNLLIVSGLSGAGKSVAMNALEDIGFFCIDNIPAALLPSITAFSKAGDNQLKRVALCMDIRGCRTPEEIEEALSQLDAQGIEYEILFLDAPDDVLMRRYSETRRRHPLMSDGMTIEQAMHREQELLLDGVAVTAGQSVSAVDIAAGKLVWTPPANGFGNALASLEFRVTDAGNVSQLGNRIAMFHKTSSFGQFLTKPV